MLRRGDNVRPQILGQGAGLETPLDRMHYVVPWRRSHTLRQGTVAPTGQSEIPTLSVKLGAEVQSVLPGP